jgi:hypothetical protein
MHVIMQNSCNKGLQILIDSRQRYTRINVCIAQCEEKNSNFINCYVVIFFFFFFLVNICNNITGNRKTFKKAFPCF